MALPWIKMWLEGLDDPKLTRLSLAERGAWWGLLKLAGKCEAGGKIMSGDQGLDIGEIADALHIKNSEDRQALDSMLTKMEARGSVKWNDDSLVVVNYAKRQRIPPSSQPEAIAERVRLHRERRKKTGNGSEVQPLPTAGEGEEAPPVIGQKAARDSEEATGTLKKAGDEGILAVWAGVKGFPQGEVALGFLNKLRAEFPDVDILEESKKWAAAKLSNPLIKQSLPFKQLWNWMVNARKFKRGRGGEDPDKYIRGKYGHMVRR